MVKEFIACIAGAASLAAVADNVEYTVSEPETLATKQENGSSWSPLHINADLTVTSGGRLYAPYGDKFYLPDAANVSASLTLDGGDIEFFYPVQAHGSALVIGRSGGRGHVVVKGRDQVFNHIQVAANAEADESGYVDFFTIENGSALITSVSVESAAPARMVFRGGVYRPTQPYTDTTSFDIFKPAAGHRLVLWADDGASIKAQLNTGSKPASFQLSSGEGCVETGGPGEFLITSTAGGRTGAFENAKVYFNADPEHLKWNHTGDTVLSNAVFGVLSADNALPCGPQTGDFRMKTWWNGTSSVLDLAGHTAGVNSLYVQKDLYMSCGGVTNSSETTAGVLEFGRFDMDTVCEARQTFGNVVIRKVGRGVLTLRNTMVETLEVTSGVCRVGAGVKVARARVTGGYLEIPHGETFDCADVTCSGEGRIRRVVAADTMVPGTDSLNEAVLVSGGTLTVYDSDRANKYWRLVIRQAHNWYTGPASYLIYDEEAGAWTEEKQTICLALQRFHLFGYLDAEPDESKRLNAGLSEATVGTPASGLQAGQIVSAKPYLTGTYCCDSSSMKIASVGPSALCLARGDWGKNIAWNNAKLESGKSSTWETVSMRLKDDAAPVAGFTYVTSGYNPPGFNPMAITIECSADGNGPWVAKYGNDDLGNRHYAHPAFYPNGNVTALTNNPHGSFNACPQVEVAAGAALVLDNLPRESIAFNGLAVDMDNGAGSISYFAPAPDGTLSLRSTQPVAEGVIAKGPTFAEVGGVTRNLRTWRVVVNGVDAPKFKVRLTADGRLELVERKGLLILCR